MIQILKQRLYFAILNWYDHARMTQKAYGKGESYDNAVI